MLRKKEWNAEAAALNRKKALQIDEKRCFLEDFMRFSGFDYILVYQHCKKISREKVAGIYFQVS